MLHPPLNKQYSTSAHERFSALPEERSFIEALREFRRSHRLGDAEAKLDPMARESLELLTQQLRDGEGASRLRGLLQTCEASDNPRGAAATLIDALMPTKRVDQRIEVEGDGSFMPFYKKAPIEAFWVSETLQLRPGERLYDIGGADGKVSALFALLNPRAHVISLELQNGLVNEARSIKERLNVSNLTIVHGDALHADLSEASAVYLDFPFDARVFAQFLFRFDKHALPTFVLNNMDEVTLEKRFANLERMSGATPYPDISVWRPTR